MNHHIWKSWLQNCSWCGIFYPIWSIDLPRVTSEFSDFLTVERTHEWPAGSLEDLVSNLVKNWEKEASYKTRLEDWRTINTKTYKFSCNGGVKYTAEEMMELGTYNALIQVAILGLCNSFSMSNRTVIGCLSYQERGAIQLLCNAFVAAGTQVSRKFWQLNLQIILCNTDICVIDFLPLARHRVLSLPYSSTILAHDSDVGSWFCISGTIYCLQMQVPVWEDCIKTILASELSLAWNTQVTELNWKELQHKLCNHKRYAV